jgi:hypothetical protein
MTSVFIDSYKLSGAERQVVLATIKESTLSDTAKGILQSAFPPEYRGDAAEIWKWEEPCPRCGMYPRPQSGDTNCSVHPETQDEIEQAVNEINESGIAHVVKRLGWLRSKDGSLYDIYHFKVMYREPSPPCHDSQDNEHRPLRAS